MLGVTINKKITIEEVLAKNAKIKFSINNGAVWYTTTVENIQGNEVILAFPEMFAAVDVILGYKVKCRFTDDKYEYGFDGEIDCIKVYFPQQIIIRVVSDIEKFENSRESKRSDTLFLANVLTGNQKKEFHSCVREVSTTGLKLISKFDLGEGSDVVVHIALPTRNIFDSLVTVKGKVVRSKAKVDHNEYGIAITDICDKHRQRIQQFINTYTG
jgi:hypothetical protein